MEILHTDFVTSVKRESLLHLPVVETCYFDLFSICHELIKCDFNADEKLSKVSTLFSYNVYYLMYII